MAPLAHEDGCPACGGHRCTGFDWDAAVAGRLGEPRVGVGAVRLVRALKFGELLACTRCAQAWFRMRRGDGGSPQSWTKLVPAAHADRVARWDAQPHRPSDATRAILREIGASPAERLGFGARTVGVPCRAVLATGEARDPALVWFCRHPPVEPFQTRVAWIEDVREVGPSRFALPKDVRVAAALAPEVRMSFRPLPVLAADGRELTLDGPEDFLDAPGVDPSRVRVGRAGRSDDVRGPVVTMPWSRVTFVVADWTPEAEALRLPAP